MYGDIWGACVCVWTGQDRDGGFCTEVIIYAVIFFIRCMEV